MNQDLFVTAPRIHTILRGIAVFIVAPLLIYKGYIYNDLILLLLGIGTLLVDGWTLYLSLR